MSTFDPKNQGPFSNPAMVTSYSDDTPRKVPGLADLHRMAMLLLSERALRAAHILVVGAGGGMELKAMAEAQREWTFTGVDPSAAMLDLARRSIEPFNDRIELIEGTVGAVPSASFDGAACLLTLHFLDKSERLLTLKEIHRRLKPDARLVVAHHSVPSGGAERWMARSAAFADRVGVDWQKAMASAVRMAELPLLSVAEEEVLLREAGFSDVELFYAAFSFRGWVATARSA
ncbi:tRNA (cmo5U34)-methyltransferase [Rhodoligotrophos appendicifer]|uniref:class I SAM-dependent methyltransferase n=1 Tax=Rhodoligotrophos appendicifer TaxID=987056 RepID=UPI001185E4BD|nr:class I SAM-dependent methyltransferase [Rhodoligotrophos appendicifer]